MSVSSPSLYAIVPLFNEAQNVQALADSFGRLERALSQEFKLFALFVDDGSGDQTTDLLGQKKPAAFFEILKHPENLGPGAAFATGFSRLQGTLKPGDWVMTLEGDATSTPETILRMLRRRQEGYDVVLASPYLYGGGFSHVPLFRLLISHLANSLVKIVLGIRGIATFSCFLRLYRGETILALQQAYGPGIVGSKGFEAMVELLGKLVVMKASISEIETRVDWTLRKGKSKMRIVKTALGYFKLLMNWRTLSRPGSRG